MKAVNLPVRKTMCGTCPFRDESPTAYLKADLTEASMKESRICHSTGTNNAFHQRTGIKSHLCRGSRNVQLDVMCAAGVITESTDEAWNDQRVRCGMKPQIITDPQRASRTIDALVTPASDEKDA